MACIRCLGRSQREFISVLIWKGLYLSHSLLFDFLSFIRLCSGPHPQTSRGREGARENSLPMSELWGQLRLRPGCLSSDPSADMSCVTLTSLRLICLVWFL